MKKLLLFLLLSIVKQFVFAQVYSKDLIIKLFNEEQNYKEIVRLIESRGAKNDDWDLYALGRAKTELGRLKCEEIGGFMWHSDEAYFKDKGIDPNNPIEIEASKLWEEAIKLGENCYAPYLLALHKYDPLKNYARAMSLYRLSADNGNAHAQLEMGRYFEEGKFVSVDFNEAIRWYTLASDNGEGGADMALGLCNEQLYRKTNEPRYLKKALKYFYKANKKGYARTVITKNPSEEDDRTSMRFENPSKQLYEEGVMNAYKYKTFEEWEDNVVAKLAKESVVDSHIPRSAEKKNVCALIISNENYKYEHYVPYAENDGESVHKYFNYTLGIPSDNIHLVKDVSLNDMKREIEWLIEKSSSGTDKVYLYYIGHGIPATNLSTSYLLPIDGYAKDPTSGLDVSWIYSKLGESKSQAIVFFDACFSGYGRHQKMLVESRGVAVKPRESQPITRTVIFSACQGVEMAYPYEEQQHGLFTYCFLKQLQETKGSITLGQLASALTNNVIRISKEEKGVIQTPNITVSQDMIDEWKNIKF